MHYPIRPGVTYGALLACLLFAGRASLPAAQEPSPDATVHSPAASIDPVLTDLSRIFAGMMPSDTARYRAIINTRGWQVHRQLSDTNWTKFNQRVAIIESWRDSILSGTVPRGATLFYPFSGPDFLYAHIFFPGCERYILSGLERVGTIPEISATETHFNDFFEDIRLSLSDIFKRNYFITRRMEKAFRTEYLQGTMTAVMVFMARRGCDIVSIKRVYIDSAGTLQYLPSDTIKAPKRCIGGVEFIFLRRGASTVQQVLYFPGDVQDSVLARKPNFVAYIRSLPGRLMFTKAASYLMHDNVLFSKIRDLSLESSVVLQEDSGIPFRFFRSDRWAVTLFGTYRRPIRDFAFGFQKDLEAAYTKGILVHPLPFPFGYHSRDSASNLMLAVRR